MVFCLSTRSIDFLSSSSRTICSYKHFHYFKLRLEKHRLVQCNVNIRSIRDYYKNSQFLDNININFTVGGNSSLASGYKDSNVHC